MLFGAGLAGILLGTRRVVAQLWHICLLKR